MVRAYQNFTKTQNPIATPQSQPIPGREAEMLPNNTSGFGFKLNDWERLNRFLIIGSERGTYYVSETKLTEQNAEVAIRCIKADGVRAVEMAVNINLQNRAPKVDSQLFVLALALKHGDAATKKAVESAAPRVLRTGTHVLHFASVLDGLGGWNRTKRRIIARWFEDQLIDKLAFQVLKYQNRDGWRMLDLLRVSHPRAVMLMGDVYEPSQERAAVYDWVRGKTEGAVIAGESHWPAALPAILGQHGTMNALAVADPAKAALWGIGHGLPREALPTEALNDPKVWTALLPDMPPHALLRNLGNLSKHGVITNGSPAAVQACQKLRDTEALKKARVHPFAVLLAALVYRSGKSVRGSGAWPVTPSIMAALEDAYDATFANVTPTGARILIGVDISGSMGVSCVGSPIAAATAAQAMAVTLARLEPNAVVVEFDTVVQRIVPVTPRTGIASLQENTNGGGTDVAAPICWAAGTVPTRPNYGFRSGGLAPQGPQVFDAFIILTDNESWAGKIHPAQALEQYRKTVNPKAKLICCSMAANHANVVDPEDVLSLGCAGLDTNLPSIAAEFIRG